MRAHLLVGFAVLSVVGVVVSGPPEWAEKPKGPNRSLVDETKLDKLIEALEDGQHSVRISAMKKLASYGTAAKKAVPALGEILRGPYNNLADEAARSVAQIGKASLSELIKGLDPSRPAVCQRSLVALRLLGPEAAQAVEGVCGLLDHKEPKVRALAAQVLGEIGPIARAAAPRLASALRDRDSQIRMLAGEALHEIGLDNVAFLLPLLQDKEISYRLNAVQVLPLFHERLECARGLAACLRDKEVRIRSAAAANLVRLGPAAKPVAMALLQSLQENDRELSYSQKLWTAVDSGGVFG